jgi:hypothetical protein
LHHANANKHVVLHPVHHHAVNADKVGVSFDISASNELTFFLFQEDVQCPVAQTAGDVVVEDVAATVDAVEAAVDFLPII